MAKAEELLSPAETAQAYWFLFPRAFWPYPDRMDGLDGFHLFLQRLTDQQRAAVAWTRDDELLILMQLADEGALPIWEDQEDYHVHFRNRVNFAKKLGLATSGMERPLELTPAGEHFLTATKQEWPDLFEHLLIRTQFPNAALTQGPRAQRYLPFQLFPYTFTLSIILNVEGAYLTLEEFALRVMLVKSDGEKDDVLQWISDFRGLNDSDREGIKGRIDLNHNYAARMVMLTFANTPSLQFADNVLAVRDTERARYILAKCVPYLAYQDYVDEDQWYRALGQFNLAFWPLMPLTATERTRAFRRYARREEGEAHKTIKRYTVANAERLFGTGARLFEEEYVFASGDKANLVFSLPNGRYIAVEVEVDVGDTDKPGLLQAIKYRYMFPAQEEVPTDNVQGYLVARHIASRMKELCTRYGINWHEAQI